MSAGDNAAEANHRIAPLLNGTKNRIYRVNITTSSAVTDLSAILPQVDDGHYYTFRPIGANVHLAFNNANSGTVNEATVDGGATSCVTLPDGVGEDWQVPDGFHYLVAKGASACTLCISLSSKNPGQTVGKEV